MLKEVNWSIDRDYKTGSEDQPLQFYLDALCNSNTFDLLLGYFSSSALRVLALGFANFIYSGGKMRAIINNVLSLEDKNAIEKGQAREQFSTLYNFNNIKELTASLDEYGKHFFECFAWLIANDRIEIKIIKPKDGKGISHYKSGIFSDGIDTIGFKSSCNFTEFGLRENLEELDCFLSWEDLRSNKFIRRQKAYFNEIFTEQADFVEYLSIKEVKAAIKTDFGDKNIQELLFQEKVLLDKRNKIFNNPKVQLSVSKAIRMINEFEEIEKAPKFPYQEGPRPYQTEAYNKWVANDRKGLFAMATGTGKTITSLNCILQDYKINKFYKFIVLVPTISLASQWGKEITEKFNFQELIICSSQNSNWEDSIRDYGRNIKLGNEVDFCILLTYSTFRGKRFQNILYDLFRPDFGNITLIADEAHTFGSTNLLKVLPIGIEKRIGLSATPERQYDEVGGIELSQFFNSNPPNYTFNYNMRKAIDDKVLCRYFYYPKIVELATDELNQYREITIKLYKFLDLQTGKYREDPYVNMLLIKRKNIIHKAKNKTDCLTSIIDEIGSSKFKHAFIYVPEGFETNYDENDLDSINNEDESIINKYSKLLYDKYKFRIKKFTGETDKRDEILSQFAEGKLDALLAMKCLDEGVDIPQTKYAIFCSSTGNPRQYIQRRGRVLRRHGEKEYAFIYDMIVKPVLDVTSTDSTQSKLEKGILISELKRLVNFAVLAENKLDCLKDLEELCYSFEIDIYGLANIEEEKYNL